jgi:hypothetical protein
LQLSNIPIIDIDQSTKTMYINENTNLVVNSKITRNKIKLKNKNKLVLKNKLTKEFMRHVQRSDQKRNQVYHGVGYSQSYRDKPVFQGINQTYSMNESFNNENQVRR